MYVPHAFRQDEVEKLVEFMRAHSFATLVSVLEGVPFASHVPLVVGYQDGLVGLTGHVANKLSQNRSTADQRTVAHALIQSADPTVAGVGEAMKKALKSGGRQ